jgi:cystathionine beta-synthase
VVVTPTSVPAEPPGLVLLGVRPAGPRDPGAWKPDQYSNPRARPVHYATTGPEIWADTDGRVTHFITGVGTGGTISGTGGT